MASASSTALSLSSSSTFVDAKALARQKAVVSSPQCVTLPSQIRLSSTTVYYRKMARNVVALATGEAPTEVATTTETLEITKKVQEAWDKVEDKYAVSTLALVVIVALWGSTGIISAIDRLPLIPGILELVGIGYTAWFVYKNLIFKPEREALLQKINDTYKEITGSS
ncbi:hypothetical protein HRI_003767400 [Hibiscus trionum]|uniref:Cyanobacterial aminoacyl-tRNA synthetase CAAD domain-containing protein n=1 Tax=Hibiscus trionum TaxID=183268 RepID=A0A9W7IRP1_HIBTR|nr:hypothetical protein HRI_003767400 [Hibiscus trionum]